jgi:hypothetical protein
MTLSSAAQIQQAWVARYNNGITSGTNQAVKMALDSAGNIYVVGFSQNTNNQLGYVTIKYAPNGTQLWVSRCDSTNYPTATPAGMVLDSSNNVIVTGNAFTIKYDSNGNQLWTAPYAGTALAVDNTANVYVVGFSQDFGTVKLSPQGSNIWLKTYVDNAGPTISQSIVVDNAQDVYVSGLDTYFYVPPGGGGNGPYVYLTTIKYDSSGGQIWLNADSPSPPVNRTVQVETAAVDGSNNLYVAAFFNVVNQFVIYKYSPAGVASVINNPEPGVLGNLAEGLALDTFGNLLLTGSFTYLGPSFSYETLVYGTYKANTNGSWIWTNFYPSAGNYQPSAGLALAVDSANSSYATGYSAAAASTNSIVTIKYSSSGNQVWLQSYNASGNGNDAGNAIAVDKNGNVYVAGYDTTTAGGTEMVLIKYSPMTLQRKPDGTVLLETQGSPGESFDIEASADLLNWLDLGSVLADTNGLMQFDDTKAPQFNARFYYTKPQ